jgi:hypothetical protein
MITQADSTLQNWLAAWERAGPAAVEQDLIENDGKHLCGGSGNVRRLAWQWLRSKRVDALQSACGRRRE